MKLVQLNELMDRAFPRVTQNDQWVDASGVGCSIIELLREAKDPFVLALPPDGGWVGREDIARALVRTIGLDDETARELAEDCNWTDRSVTGIQEHIRAVLYDHFHNG